MISVMPCCAIAVRLSVSCAFEPVSLVFGMADQLPAAQVVVMDLSDEQLDRLLSCMGYRLQVSRQPVAPILTRSERRSWKLHRQLARHLTRSTLAQWEPTVERNLQRLRAGATGQPHMRNLDRWGSLLERGDVPGLHRVLTGLDRDSIEMREVPPMGGLLPDEERIRALHAVK
jgi:hypothetical protein